MLISLAKESGFPFKTGEAYSYQINRHISNKERLKEEFPRLVFQEADLFLQSLVITMYF